MDASDDRDASLMLRRRTVYSRVSQSERLDSFWFFLFFFLVQIRLGDCIW